MALFIPLLKFLTSNESYWDKIERHHRIVAPSVDGICIVLVLKKRKKGRQKRKREKKERKKRKVKIKLNA